MSKSVKFGRLECLENRSLPSTYIVATAGNDANPGSLASPFATIQHALNVATKPGDVVQVRSGAYHEKITFPASGAKSGSISLTAFPGEHPILDGTGVAGQNMVTLKNVSFVKLSGFEIENLKGVNDGSAIRVTGYGSNIEIRNNVIHDIRGTSAMGITVYGTSAAKSVAYLIIDNNEIYNAEPAPSEALTLNGNITQFQLTANRVHDVNGIGIDMIGGDRAVNRSGIVRNGIVRGNTVSNAHANYGGGFAPGIYVDGGLNIVLEYNVSHNNDIGIRIGAENSGIAATGNSVRNNLIYRNDKAGLAIGGLASTAGRVKSSLFENNTVYQNDTLGSGFGQLWIQYASGNAFSNNIFVASTNDVLIASVAGNTGNRLMNNLYFAPDGSGAAEFSWNGIDYLSLASFQATTRTDTSSLFGDPDFVSPATANFHLQAGSPAVDTGSAARNRYAITDFEGRARESWAPDIGAFEYFAAPTTGAGLTPDQKRRAEQLTSIFENDTTDLQYSYFGYLGDGRGYTAGRAGFTTRDGDLLDVVERYTARVPGNLLAQYLPRLRQLAAAHSGSISGLGGIIPAWQNAAGDSIFRAVQDQVVDETYYQPAMAHVLELGLQTALGKAAVYDAIIQHGDGSDLDGLPALLSRTAAQVGGTPATGVNEQAWVDKFLHLRRSDLEHSYNPATRAAWADSVARVDVLLDIEAAGNWSLFGPINVDSDVYGQFTIA
jgi:hypothetical protein